jgi:hypothetical protein
VIETFVGVDNGISGAIGIITKEEVRLFKTPVVSEQNYTKEKQNITRVNIFEFIEILRPYVGTKTRVWLERPMVNPTRFRATGSALRALESTINVLQTLKISFEYVDSKAWQKALLPAGLKGSDELKKASLDVGKRLFPSIDFKGYKDADSLLIAEYQRRKETR